MATESHTASAYLRTKVLTASPEELRLMLLDGAIKFARQGRDGLARRDYEATFTGFSRCRDIVLELINSIRPEIDPDLCNRVAALYTFIYTELLQASVGKDTARADKAIELLEFERQTWLLLMQKLAAERAGTAAPTPTPAPAAHPTLALEHVPLSLEA